MGMMGWDESVIRQIVVSKRVRTSRKVWLKPSLGRGDRVFVENEDGVFLPVEEWPVDFEAGRGNPPVVAPFLPSVDLVQWCLLTSCR